MRHLLTRLTFLFASTTRPTFARQNLRNLPTPHRNPVPFRTIMSSGILSSFFGTAKTDTTPRAVQKSEEEWRAVLSPEQFRVLRKKGTEPAGSSVLDKVYSPGLYTCAGCDTPLYEASTKFDSHCGWPAFYKGVEGAIETHEDNSFGMRRTEIVCKNCGGHLGHVFKGEDLDAFNGPSPTRERHCVNGISLKFTPANEGEKESKA